MHQPKRPEVCAQTQHRTAVVTVVFKQSVNMSDKLITSPTSQKQKKNPKKQKQGLERLKHNKKSENS